MEVCKATRRTGKDRIEQDTTRPYKIRHKTGGWRDTIKVSSQAARSDGINKARLNLFGCWRIATVIVWSIGSDNDGFFLYKKGREKQVNDRDSKSSLRLFQMVQMEKPKLHKRSLIGNGLNRIR